MKFGFTLIESIISIAIIGIVVVFAFSGFRSFQESAQLNEAHSAILEMLRDARARTLSGEKNIQYGVHFETNQIILFSGSSYVPGFVSNEPYAFPALTKISAINLGGPADVVFSRLSGSAPAFGTITVQSNSNPLKTKTITILSSGNIE